MVQCLYGTISIKVWLNKSLVDLNYYTHEHKLSYALRAPVTEEIFLDFESICLDQDRCLSINCSNDLASSSLLIFSPSISVLIWSLTCVRIHWHHPDTMNSRLAMLRLSLLPFSQQFSFSS